MKNMFQSKTVWFNLLYIVILIAGVFGFGGFQPDQKTMELGGLIVAAINLVLRYITNTPVSFSVWKK